MRNQWQNKEAFDLGQSRNEGAKVAVGSNAVVALQVCFS